MPLLSSFIVVLAVSVVWDISGFCSYKCASVFLFSVLVGYCFFFRHSQRPNRQPSDLSARTEDTAHCIRTSLLVGKILLFTLYEVPKYEKDTYKHFQF